MSSISHPPVDMAESRRYEPVELLRVHKGHVVAWLRRNINTANEEERYHCIGSRWVDETTHKVFPQSRGYATWMEEPTGEELSYLGHLLSLPGVDVKAVARVLQHLSYQTK